MRRIPITRVATILGVVGVVWFALAAMWGMFGVPGGGHYGAPFGCAISAENMITWRVIAPVWEYVTSAPTPSLYYCHHPFFSFWDELPAVVLFGHRDWAVYVPPVLESALTAYFVNRAANNAWGPVGALAATAGYVMLPITLAFANFNDLEVPTIFGAAMFFWGHSELLKSWKTRYWVWSALGAVIATNSDWPGFIVMGVFLGYTLVRYSLPRRLFPPMRDRSYARWWMAACALTAATLVFYLAAFAKWNQFGELLSSANQRSSGSALPLSAVLEARKYRIEACFTSLAILLGKAALPIGVMRLVVRRRDEELYSLATLVAATIQYVGFKQGADIHVFWPHYFGLYFAFALGQLVVSIQWVVQNVLRIARRPWADSAASITAVSLTLAFVVAIAPDALRGLRTGRETWGRFNEENLRNDSDVVRVLEMLSPRLAPGQTLDAHASLKWGWTHSWALHGLHAETSAMPTRATNDASHPFFVMRASWSTAHDLEAMARDFHLQIYGDVLVIDRREAPAPLDGFTFEEKEPNPVEWFFLGGIEPVEHLVHDPYATWEWRTHLGQHADPPSEPPRTSNQLRIAHNIAVASGDSARAQALRAQIQASLLPDSHASYTQGVELLGTRLIGGTSPRVESLWLANEGATAGEAQLNVQARMDGKARWTFVDPDTLVRPFNLSMPIPTKLWRRGFLYDFTLVLFHRIGKETYVGGFWSRDGKPAPTRVDGAETVDLITVR